VTSNGLGLAGLWGIAGVVAILAQAIFKLAPLAVELLELELTVGELAILASWIALAGYAEGVRGFHRQFSPRVVARAQHLSARARTVDAILAPVFCMGLIHATRRRLITSWVLTLAITAVVMFVRRLSQPWRGIVDAGVVIGLSIGVMSLIYFTARGIRGHAMPVPADVPERSTS
jgi:hypothetical protein